MRCGPVRAGIVDAIGFARAPEHVEVDVGREPPAQLEIERRMDVREVDRPNRHDARHKAPRVEWIERLQRRVVGLRSPSTAIPQRKARLPQGAERVRHDHDPVVGVDRRRANRPIDTTLPRSTPTARDGRGRPRPRSSDSWAPSLCEAGRVAMIPNRYTSSHTRSGRSVTVLNTPHV